MNGVFRQEMKRVLKAEHITLCRLAFEIGITPSHASEALSGQRPLTRKLLASFIDGLEKFEVDDIRLRQLAKLGCERIVEEHGLDQLCDIRLTRVMEWLREEPTYAVKIGIKQREKVLNRIKARRSNG